MKTLFIISILATSAVFAEPPTGAPAPGAGTNFATPGAGKPPRSNAAQSQIQAGQRAEERALRERADAIAAAERKTEDEFRKRAAELGKKISELTRKANEYVGTVRPEGLKNTFPALLEKDDPAVMARDGFLTAPASAVPGEAPTKPGELTKIDLEKLAREATRKALAAKVVLEMSAKAMPILQRASRTDAQGAYTKFMDNLVTSVTPYQAPGGMRTLSTTLLGQMKAAQTLETTAPGTGAATGAGTGGTTPIPLASTDEAE